jgi:hypothetical protein
VIGIPLGVFTLLALALLYTVGYVGGAIAIGRMIVKEPTSRYVSFLAGLGLLRLIALVPVAGGLAFTVVSVFGFGAMAVAARRRSEGVGGTVVTPPPPPMPA